MQREDLVDYEVCTHCNEPRLWQDMFGRTWCSELMWGLFDLTTEEEPNA